MSMMRMLMARGAAEGEAAPPADGAYQGFGAVGQDGTSNTALNAERTGPADGLTVYNVTNPDGNASGAGSFRTALSVDGRRVVLQTDLDFGTGTEGDYVLVGRNQVFIDGNGYTITRGTPTGGLNRGNSSWQLRACTNMVWYNCRIQMGWRVADFNDITRPERGDCLTFNGDNQRVILRRCTFRGGDDGGVDIVGFSHSSALPSPWTNMDISIQECFFYDQVKTSLIKYGPHAYISFYRNVMARTGERNPQIRGTIFTFDMVNNINYGWAYDGFGGYGVREYIEETEATSQDEPPPAITDMRTGGDHFVQYNMIGNQFMAHSTTLSPQGGWTLSNSADNNFNPSGQSRGDVYAADNVYSTDPTYLAGISTVASPLTIPASSQVTAIAASSVPASLLAISGSAGAVGALTMNADEIALINEMRTDFGL